MTRTPGLAPLCAIAVFSLTACAGETAADTPGTAAGGVSVVARTMLVRTESFADQIDAIGIVTVRREHAAALGAPAPARVNAVRVSVGDRVRRGTVLVVLDPATFDAAVRSADASLQTATRTHERARRLVAAGILPQKDLDLATSDLAQTTASTTAARRQRALATLRSPIDGIVTRLSATLGASVDAATALVEVADPRFVDVVLGVSASDAAEIAPGMRVSLRAGQAEGADSIGAGVVTTVAVAIDTVARTVSVRVGQLQMRRALRIGETINGRIQRASRADAVLVPAGAIVPDGDAYRVFVVDTAGIAHARSVKIGGRSGDRVELTAGLAVGERIVTDGAYQIDDGVRIVVPKP